MRIKRMEVLEEILEYYEEDYILDALVRSLSNATALEHLAWVMRQEGTETTIDLAEKIERMR